MKKKVLALFACAVLSAFMIGGVVLAGNVDFSYKTPWWSNDGTAVDFQTKTTNSNGSYIKLNTAVAAEDQIEVWTDIKFKNGDALVQYSPRKVISTRSATNVWLGAYVQYTGVSGDQVRLRMRSDKWNGDHIVGNWDYK